jgi:hypothetical protein
MGPRPPVDGQPRQSVPRPREPQQTAGTPYPPQAQAAPAYGSSKFVGDAQPFGGMPLSRIWNAACYVVAGIALLVISAQPGIPVVAPLIIGLAFIAYGINIAVTRGSYWIASIVYVLAIGAVLAMPGLLSR